MLSLGTATFGGGNDFFKSWGSTQVEEARRMVNLCLDASVNLFDSTNVYSRAWLRKFQAKPSPKYP